MFGTTCASGIADSSRSKPRRAPCRLRGRVLDPTSGSMSTDLAAVYLGGFTFMDLLHAGRVEELSERAAMRACLLFHRARAPWCPEVI